MLAVFLASPLFGLPLIGRYVRTPAVLLALFYGLAVFGWRMLPPGDERRRWVVAGVLAAALSVAFLPWHVKMLSSLDERLVYQGAYYRDLREVGRAPAVRAALAALRPDRDRRPPPDPAPALVARGRPGHRRPVADRAAVAARSCCCSRAGRACALRLQQRLRGACCRSVVAAGDAGGVPRQPAVRAAADRPLRAHAGRPARALLRPRRVRLADAARRATSAAAGPIAGVLAAALSLAFLPWHVKMLSDLDDRLVYQGAYYRDLREVGRAPAVRAALERLRPDRDGRPPPDPAPALVARRRPGHRRPGRRPRGDARLARSRCCPAARARCGASTARTSRPPSARPARGCSTATRRGACSRRRAAHALAWRQGLGSGWRGRSRRWPSSRAIACSRSAAGTAWRPRWSASGSSAAGGRLTAIDRSAKMIALATRRNREHVAAGRARFATVALEQADFGGERFDKVFGVHVAALWRSQAALAVVRAHLAPAGALYIVNQLPGRRTRADARAFAEPVAAALRRARARGRGAAVRGPRAVPGRLRDRPSAERAARAARSAAAPS